MLKKEVNYQFRDRLRSIHKKDLRNFSLSAENDEFEIKNGITVVLPKDSTEVTLTAAQDFVEYLFVSMKVSAMIGYEASGDAVVLKIAPENKEDYIITFDDVITITGKNERGLAQGLYCLEDKMNVKKAPFIKKETISHTFLFSPRMIHSGYGIDNFPNEHLASIAHAGMDAILIFVKGVNMTTCGYVDFNELIKRAAKYGIDVYAYSYLKSEMNPEDEGGEEFYDNLYGELFRQCPGFKGVILVGESVGFPSRDERVSQNNDFTTKDGFPTSKPRPGYFPCKDYPIWLNCIKKVIKNVKPDADIVFWTYNWGWVGEKERIELIRTLPTDISLMATYEMFENFVRGNIKQTGADYSLAFEGPGTYFSSEAKAAAERGIRMYTMSNTGGLTWDMGTIPYEPMPYQWMKRYAGLREYNEKYGLCGLMESHHFGFWPSFIGDLAKQCYIAENKDMDKCLSDVLEARYGSDKVEKMKEALALWSEAIRNYTPTDADQYGAFRVGPSYPLCLVNAVKPPSVDYAHFGNGILDVIYPADYSPTNRLPCGRGMLPQLRLAGELELLNKMLEYMRGGLKILKEIENPDDELLYLINLGEYICCCVTTGIHAKEWYKVTSDLKVAKTRQEVRGILEEVKAILRAERANAETAIPLVENDSRLGWEPSMEYMTDAEHIRWKLRHMDYVEEFELKCYLDGSDEKWDVK
ncbi:MAG: hypothetical protein II978_06415 [Clostridia bacterium]|nr:hypothetical protein [Clostridia bacterium]